jgi:hypothetical protein
MATSSSIKNLNPRLQSVFGILTPSDGAEIRKILSNTDEMLLEFAYYFGSNRAGREGTGLELTWFPSGQIEISSFVETGLDGEHCVSFIVSLQPTWFYGDFPTEQEWEIEAEIYADCQHKVYCGNMHCVYKLPAVTSAYPIDAVTVLRDTTAELIKLGKEKPLEYWLQLAGDSQAL